MNDFDLEARLKRVPLPERPEDYWEDFPARVRRRLRPAVPRRVIHESRVPQPVWQIGACLAGLVIGLLVLSQPLKAASGAVFQQEQFVRRQLVALPRGLHVLMADEHGLHYLVAEMQ